MRRLKIIEKWDECQLKKTNRIKAKYTLKKLSVVNFIFKFQKKVVV